MQTVRFIAFIIVVFTLCALPFLLVQVSGISSAGFAAGFRAPLEEPWLLAMLLAIGMASSATPKEGFMLIPFGLMMMVFTGTSLMMVLYQQQPMWLFVVGGVLLYITALMLIGYRTGLLALLFAGSIGFHVGLHLVLDMPSIAAPLFYLFGLLLAITLLLAIAVAFGITLMGERESLNEVDANENNSPLSSASWQ